jgi:hypothetical protein
MSCSLPLLLDLLKIATTLHRRQTALSVIPICDMITELDLLPDIYSKKTQDDLARLIEETAAEPTTFTSGVTKIVDICRQEYEQHDGLSSKPSVDREIGELLGFVLALASENIKQFLFSPENIQIFRFIRTFAIKPIENGFETYLISNAPADADITIKTVDTHVLLKRVEISYGKASIYPKMNIRIPSMNQDSALQNMRVNWSQTDTPEDDLEIYNYDQKKLGRIITRPAALPYTIPGKKISVRIPSAENAHILVTDILSKNDDVVSRFIKLTISGDSHD